MPLSRSATALYRLRYPMPPTSIRPVVVHAAPEVKTAESGAAPADLAQPPQTLILRLDLRQVCRTIRQITAEMLLLSCDRVQMRRDRRRSGCHVRQISMYICHVALRLSLTDIGIAFGRDRTTVSHACNVVEDRRDNAAFDDLVSAIERVATAFFGAIGGLDHA